MQTRCSFKFAIEISTKAVTEVQEKNHTDHRDLSSRTPLGQLIQRAVRYTHRAGADGSTATLPSRKKISPYFWVPPRTLILKMLDKFKDYMVSHLVEALR